MADRVSPIDLINDRAKYPDDMVIALADGREISVKDYRDAVRPKAEFTRDIEAVQARERDLQTQLQTAQQNVAREIEARQALEARAAATQGRQVPMTGLSEEDYLNDPVLGPQQRKIKALEERLESLWKEGQTRIQQTENTILRDRFMGTLATIAARHNAEFKDKPFDQGEFLDKFQRNPLMRFDPQTGQSLPDMETFHANMTHEDRIKAREAEAEQRGIKKGQEQARVPRVPFGRRSASPAADAGPKTFGEVTQDTVLNDPEMVGLLNGEPQE